MNRFACIGFQKRRIRPIVSLYSPIFGGGDDLLVGVEVQGEGSRGGIDGGCHRGRRWSPGGGAGGDVVGPRSCDDLRDADVAAVAARLGAELALEVGREAEDEGRGAVERGGEAGGGEMAAAEVVGGWERREIGI